MNELTLEELQIILFWGIDRLEGVGIENFKEEGHIGLFHKLQEMVVSYCEHKWSAVGNHPWLHCIKCKSNFNYE